MRTRSKAREFAMQVLFVCDFHDDWKHDCIADTFTSFEFSDSAHDYAMELACGVAMAIDEIDAAISLASTNWSISRMGRVDRAVLRLATFELLHCPDVPKNVVLNEAIELAKKFGCNESSVFVNGVLDSLANPGRTERHEVLDCQSKREAA
ncbi:MAG: transcription antitermination factor NusB [bacterium]|nr:transcription antitermination factor NusB [bacterium]